MEVLELKSGNSFFTRYYTTKNSKEFENKILTNVSVNYKIQGITVLGNFIRNSIIRIKKISKSSSVQKKRKSPFFLFLSIPFFPFLSFSAFFLPKQRFSAAFLSFFHQKPRFSAALMVTFKSPRAFTF